MTIFSQAEAKFEMGGDLNPHEAIIVADGHAKIISDEIYVPKKCRNYSVSLQLDVFDADSDDTVNEYIDKMKKDLETALKEKGMILCLKEKSISRLLPRL